MPVSDGVLHPCLRGFPGAALELDAEGVVRASNGELDTLTGRPLAGLPLAEVLDDTSQQKWRQILSGAGGGTLPCRWELVFLTGSSMEVRTFLAIWGDGGEGPTLWLLEFAANPKLETLYGELSELNRELLDAQRLVGRERSRLARALEEAEAAVRARDEVLGIISHDLRSPLGTITLAAGILELPVEEETKSDQIAVIQRAAKGMERLIADLLDVSAVETGNLRLEVAPLRVEELLTEAAAMMQGHVAKKEHRLELHVAEDLPPIRGDRLRLLQVLSNLLGNAIKFTPPGGAITLSAEHGEGEVAVAVRDTGPGIPDDELPHIFDRYWHTSRGRRGGAGLGLAIATGIVEAHGGRLRAESEDGEGACFRFTLPLDPASGDRSPADLPPG
jgi:signal transduction histidine kinase